MFGRSSEKDTTWETWFCELRAMFEALGLTKVPFGEYFLLFWGFLSKSSERWGKPCLTEDFFETLWVCSTTLARSGEKNESPRLVAIKATLN